MKTSTKLFIVLFACVPLSMSAYAYLLRQQFVKGIFFQIRQNHQKFTSISLPAFKNAVIDGNLYVMRESDLTKITPNTPEEYKNGILFIGWDAQIEFTGTQSTNSLKILEGYEDIVKTKIKNDTLYVSLFKPHGENMGNFDQGKTLISINNRDLHSLNLNAGNYTLTKMSNKELSVNVTRAGLTARDVNVDTLKISAEQANSITMENSVVDVFKYMLKNNSKLILGKNEVQNFESLGVDSLSEISVQGKAKDMEKFLPALSQSSK
jgi:hypothetical protein